MENARTERELEKGCVGVACQEWNNKLGRLAKHVESKKGCLYRERVMGRFAKSKGWRKDACKVG